MTNRTSPKQDHTLGLHFTDAAGAAAPTQEQEIHDARAAAKIAQWRDFLPEDCVETMIQAGWHRTV